jgi:hypothetical protein
VSDSLDHQRFLNTRGILWLYFGAFADFINIRRLRRNVTLSTSAVSLQRTGPSGSLLSRIYRSLVGSVRIHAPSQAWLRSGSRDGTTGQSVEDIHGVRPSFCAHPEPLASSTERRPQSVSVKEDQSAQVRQQDVEIT